MSEIFADVWREKVCPLTSIGQKLSEIPEVPAGWKIKQKRNKNPIITSCDGMVRIHRMTICAHFHRVFFKTVTLSLLNRNKMESIVINFVIHTQGNRIVITSGSCHCRIRQVPDWFHCNNFKYVLVLFIISIKSENECMSVWLTGVRNTI